MSYCPSSFMKIRIIHSLLVFIVWINHGYSQTNPAVSAWLINSAGLKGRSDTTAIQAIVEQFPADIQLVRYSATDVYINASGIPSYPVGPWSGNPAVATDRHWLFRVPLNPVEQTSAKTSTPLGPIGVFINGVPIFNAQDAHSFNNQNIWHQNAVAVEGGLLPGTTNGFDSSFGHPAPVMNGGMINGLQMGEYHHHQRPISLLAQIGDPPSRHSKIIGYAFDGFPVYGPHGYEHVNGTGGVTRMQSSYRLKTGTRQPLSGGSTPAGVYDGRYIEDFEFSEGSGHLDRHNGRFASTPEYPNGIYHYHSTIDNAGNSTYPYIIGPQYYGVVATDNSNRSVTVPNPGVDEYQPAINLRFAKSSYGVLAGTKLLLEVNLDTNAIVDGEQGIPSGLFSFGIKITFPTSLGEVVSVADITVPEELNSDGLNGPAAKAIGAGFAAVKGALPLSATAGYTGAHLASFNLTTNHQAVGSFAIGLEIYRTNGNNENVYIAYPVPPASEAIVLDDRLVFASALVGIGFPLELKRGWNLISFPVLSTTPVKELLGDQSPGEAWGWDGQKLVAVEYIQPKEGYWVYSAVDRMVPIAGSTVASQSIPLNIGWNLVGPVADSPWAPITFAAAFPAAYQAPIWSWERTRFGAASQLNIGRGYWVFRPQ